VAQLPVSTRWAALSVAVHLASRLSLCPCAVKTWTSACLPRAPADTPAQTHRGVHVRMSRRILQSRTGVSLHQILLHFIILALKLQSSGIFT